jgi:hypothetical protein
MGINAHSDEWMREQTWIDEPVRWTQMARTTIEDKALRFLHAFERAGKSVGRVTIDGKKIELVLGDPAKVDEFDRIDMRHGKT